MAACSLPSKCEIAFSVKGYFCPERAALILKKLKGNPLLYELQGLEGISLRNEAYFLIFSLSWVILARE